MDNDRQVTVPAWVLGIAYAEHRATCSYCGNARPDLCRVKMYRDQLLRGLAESGARLDDEEPNRQMRTHPVVSVPCPAPPDVEYEYDIPNTIQRAAEQNREALRRLAR